ncbi:MAG: polysaccharide pyruvyl transferase family protein [Armatimonadota bacterium]|nr:polysaccharide pyruvyl transferase family protein [bacterium]
MPGKRRVLFVGCGDYGNRGCEAIIRSTVNILSEIDPSLTYTASCLDVEKPVDEPDCRIRWRPHCANSVAKFSPAWWKYRLRYGTGSWKHRMFHTQLSELKNSDCALEIGGDLYTLDYGTLGQFVCQDEALLSLGKPVFLWGASIGPYDADPAIEQMMSEHLNRLNLVFARETVTASYLASIGVIGNVRLVADPAFTLKPAQPDLPPEISELLSDGAVGLNLSSLAGKYRKDQGDNWAQLAADCARALLDAKIGPLLLIPHVISDMDNDHAFLSRIADEFSGERSKLAVLPGNLCAAEYKWVISKLRIFIGARTHSTIAALSTGVPTISIGYSTKARGINQDVYGNLDWLIPVDDLTAEVLSEKTRAIAAAESRVRETLSEQAPVMCDRAREAGKILLGYLDGK